AGVTLKTLALWDVRRGRLLRTFPANEGSSAPRLSALCFSPDGRRLAVSAGQSVRLWDTRSAKEVEGFDPPEVACVALHFSAAGSVLTGVPAGGGVVRWSAKTGAELARIGVGQKPVKDLAGAVSPDGRLWAEQGFRGALRVREVATGRERTALEQQ